MNFIELIFALLAKFVPMDSVRFASLQKDGKIWYDEIDETDEATLPFVRTIKMYGEKWFTQVGLAVAFIFLQRIVFDFLNPTASDDEDEDDD